MFKEIDDLPKEIDKVIMILDGVEDICVECTDIESDNQRWFYGKIMGAYPISEIKLWKTI